MRYSPTCGSARNAPCVHAVPHTCACTFWLAHPHLPPHYGREVVHAVLPRRGGHARTQEGSTRLRVTLVKDLRICDPTSESSSTSTTAALHETCARAHAHTRVHTHLHGHTVAPAKRLAHSVHLKRDGVPRRRGESKCIALQAINAVFIMDTRQGIRPRPRAWRCVRVCVWRARLH